MDNFLRGGKVLVMGLGFLGGGIATTKWLVRHGAKVTVTDLKSRKELASSIKSLGSAAKKVRFVLGRHDAKDFKNNEIVVVNPAVPRESRYLKIAKAHGARLENEASLFFRFCKNPIIGVTGTRGKTTTANWIYHFFKKKFKKTVLTGNSSDNPMLGALDKLDGKSPVVVELSSWHLELLPKSRKAPHVAVITNIYPDHLNRYPSMKSYALAKANIFKDQTKSDFLILNKKNKWTRFFLKLKPKSKINFFSKNGPINLLHDRVVPTAGIHNFENLNAAVLAVHFFGVPKSAIRRALRSLPQIHFRQEVIIKKQGLTVINDTTATMPEATIAALKRFSGGGTLILLAGGADKKLNFSGWAKAVKRYVSPENLYLIDGSATKKMIRALHRINFFNKSKPRLFETLPQILRLIRKQFASFASVSHHSHYVVLFSPGATSFEKFKNEFDRGEQFNRLVKRFLSRKN